MNSTQKGILYFGSFELPDKNAAANRVINNGKALRELGYNVVFCGISKSSEEATSFEYSGFKCFARPLSSKLINRIKVFVSISQFGKIANSINNLKYVVLYDLHFILLKKIINYCRRKRIVVVADVTEWYENPFSIIPSRFLKWIDTKKTMNAYHNCLDGLIVVSKYLFDYYKSDVKKIAMIPPLVDKKDSKWTNYARRNDSSLTTFVYSGEIGKNKDNLCFVLKCFELIRDEFNFEFKIAGLSESEFLNVYPEIKNTIERLEKKVTFLGRISHDESIKLLREANYCVFIRAKTRKNMAGFPTKFVECVTSGIGIVASNVSNISDYKDKCDCILLDDVDECKLTEAFRLCMNRKIETNHDTSVFDYRNHLEGFQKIFKED